MKRIAYKFRIYPTKKQEEFFAKTFGSTRFVWNTLLDENKKAYKEYKDKGEWGKIRTPAELKKEYKWLKEVDSLALANAQMNLKQAFRNIKTHCNFPKFKSKHNNKQSYKTNNQGNNIHIKNGKIKLPKVGYVKIIEHRKLKGVIKNVTVSKQAGKYFVSIMVEKEIKPLPKNNNEIGIDLGVKDLCILSSGETIENIKTTYKYEKKLKTLNKELHRRKKGSNNRKKTKYKLQRLYYKIANIRNDYLHKVSRKIINENQVICLEELNVKGMLANHKLAKAISDVSFGKLVAYLKYKADLYGRTIKQVGRFFASTKTCSTCGYKNSEINKLSIREWTCPKCNTKHNRDLNAAINILKFAV